MNNLKLIKYLFLIGFIIVVIYFLLGYLNSYVGYYGYNKHKVRRYSSSLIESKQRNVFVRKLSYSLSNDIKINNVFIEKGFRWGSSDEETLEYNDSSKLNYQIIFDYKEKQGKYLIYIPKNRKLLKTDRIIDTIQFKIFVRDYKNQLLKEDIIKVWQ